MAKPRMYLSRMKKASPTRRAEAAATEAAREEARKAAHAERLEREAKAKLAEMCEHMLAVVEACRANGVHFTAVEVDVMVCRNCKLEVDEASDVFPEAHPY